MTNDNEHHPSARRTPAEEMQQQDIRMVRLCYGDLHAILDPLGLGAQEGYPDRHVMPLPATRAPIPWKLGTAWCLADIVGETGPSELAPRSAYYLTDVEHPLLPHAHPGDLAQTVPSTLPLQPACVEHILEKFERLIVPHCTHWNSKRFIGDFGLEPSAISLLAELLESALDQTRMRWSTSPAATELEMVILDWVRQLLGLAEHMFGTFHTNSREDLAREMPKLNTYV